MVAIPSRAKQGQISANENGREPAPLAPRIAHLEKPHPKELDLPGLSWPLAMAIVRFV